jgi:hypothetical protein
LFGAENLVFIFAKNFRWLRLRVEVMITSLTYHSLITHSLTHCIAHSCYIILSLMSATGTRGAGFGLDAELAKKQAAKYDPAREAASLRW